MGGPTGRKAEVGEKFVLSFTMRDLSGSGDHGGITISFPSLTDPDQSSDERVYSSSQAHVDVGLYHGDRSNVHFRDVGDTIYSASGSTMRAEHLLVEFDEPSWTESSQVTIVLRVTPKEAGRFNIRYRYWVCADGYENCSRSEADTDVRDQQGWQAHVMTVDVTQPPGGNDHGGSLSGASDISVPATIEGQIEADGDIDVFRFSAEEGVEYSIRLESSAGFAIGIWPSDGEALAWDYQGRSRDRRIEWTAETSGVYFVAVWEYEGSEGSTGGYRLTITSNTPAPDDHGDNRGDATELRVEQDVSGNIDHPNDTDVFSFRAEQGHEYVIATRTDMAFRTTLHGVVVGPAIAQSNGTSRIVWSAPEPGVYVVVVRGNGQEPGSYTLSVTSNAPDDHGGTFEDATRISLDRDYNGNIEVDSDRDVFSFLVTSGTSYVITAIPGTVSDTRIYIYDPDLERVGEDEDGGSSQVLLESARKTGRYFISVRAKPLNDPRTGPTGSYTLRVNSVANAPDDHGGTFEDATRISLDRDYNGNIEVDSDRDVFSFEGVSGGSYVTTATPGTVANTRIYIYDPDREQVGRDTDGGASEVTLDPATKTGRYYILVRGSTGTYTLRVHRLTEVSSSPGPQVLFEGAAMRGLSEESTDAIVRVTLWPPHTPGGLSNLVIAVEDNDGITGTGTITVAVPSTSWIDFEGVLKFIFDPTSGDAGDWDHYSAEAEHRAFVAGEGLELIIDTAVGTVFGPVIGLAEFLVTAFPESDMAIDPVFLNQSQGEICRSIG